MKTIPLTQGMEALVDDEDYDHLIQWKWQYHPTDKGGYAVRTSRRKGCRVKVWMHLEVFYRKESDSIDQCDHKDRNGLNNQRTNLRPATSSLNCANRRPRENISGRRGVYWYGRYSRWNAQIRVNGKMHNLGYFDDRDEAARVYDQAAKKHFGEFSYLNFK